MNDLDRIVAAIERQTATLDAIAMDLAAIRVRLEQAPKPEPPKLPHPLGQAPVMLGDTP